MPSAAALDPAPASRESARMENAAPPAPVIAEAEEPEAAKQGWWGTVRFLLLVFLAALVLRTFIIAPFNIPSRSMLPRLMIGDYLFVSKWSYGYSRFSFPFGILRFEGRIWSGLPARGDVVVFRYPGARNEDLVKRVIGLPGDTVEVREGLVLLNGRALPRERIADFSSPVTPNSPCEGPAVRETPGDGGETLCAIPRFRETLPDGTSYEVLDQLVNGEGDTFGPVTVPAGNLFVMGDNRDDSLDSRFDPGRPRNPGVGLLPVENVLGRVTITFWSTDGSAAWIKPWTWFSAARWDRIGRTG
ncbi:MAG: signal peptidase [Sphingomonadales bacterium]|nr:signal peptidase [Sphingomonadales bacterium]